VAVVVVADVAVRAAVEDREVPHLPVNGLK